MSHDLTETQRQEIFAALVEIQDQGRTVDPSRREVASKFGLSVEDVKAIESEGLQRQWPPL
jgi:hypothetical protein